jgi:hypothetical protein
MRRVARCQGCHERGRQLRRPYIFSEIQVLLPSKGKGHDWTNDDGIGKRFPRRVEHAFDVTIQRSHHTYSGEHRWPVENGGPLRFARIGMMQAINRHYVTRSRAVRRRST